MAIKQRIAARLDRRYARTKEFERLALLVSALRSRVDVEVADLAERLETVEGRVAGLESRLDGLDETQVASVSGSDERAAKDQGASPTHSELATKQAEFARQATDLARDVQEAKRLATEASISISAIMETEVRHRQFIDSLSGDGA